METQTVPLALIAEFAMRGGAAGISVLMAGLLLSIRPLRPVTVIGALFALGAADYAVLCNDLIQDALGPVYVPVKLFALLSPAFFWLFIMAIFDDEFELKPLMAVPLVVIALLYLACIPFPASEQFSRIAHIVIVFAMMAHILRITRRSLCDDLVAARRQFTNIVVALVPAVCLAIAAIEFYELLQMNDDPLGSLAIAFVLFAVTAAFGFGITTVRKSLMPQSVVKAPSPETGETAADRFDLARLQELMSNGVYLSSGLTIGELAKQMNMPEHRLRRLINKGLGYRNFAAFINDYRIDEATRRLSTPETARDQITSLAFDLGYASLAPFNRAFRERTGMSPSQYREKALQSA